MKTKCPKCGSSDLHFYAFSNGTYQSQIMVRGKRINLGSYKTEEEAHNAYIQYKLNILKENNCETNNNNVK